MTTNNGGQSSSSSGTDLRMSNFHLFYELNQAEKAYRTIHGEAEKLLSKGTSNNDAYLAARASNDRDRCQRLDDEAGPLWRQYEDKVDQLRELWCYADTTWKELRKGYMCLSGITFEDADVRQGMIHRSIDFGNVAVETNQKPENTAESGAARKNDKGKGKMGDVSTQRRTGTALPTGIGTAPPKGTGTASQGRTGTATKNRVKDVFKKEKCVIS